MGIKSETTSSFHYQKNKGNNTNIANIFAGKAEQGATLDIKKVPQSEEYNVTGQIEDIKVENNTNATIENLKVEKKTYEEMLEPVDKELAAIKSFEQMAESAQYGGNVTVIDAQVKQLTRFNSLAELLASKEEIKDLEADKIYLDQAIYKIDQQIKMTPYDNLEKLEAYQNFTLNQNIDLNIANWELKWQGSATGESSAVLVKNISDGINLEEIDPLLIAEQIRTLRPDLYQYYKKEMSEELITLLELGDESFSKKYHYLFATEGKEKAETYLKDIKDQLNQKAGEKKAQEFLNTLEKDENGNYDLTKVSNYLNTILKGSGDGIESFFSGLAAWFEKDHVYSVDEYESMYIIQELSKNKEFKNVLDNTYELSQSMGNMAPSIAIGILCPGAGTLSMGASAGGSSYHQAMVEGSDQISAITYGVLSGVSEATLEKYLGALPGLSEVSATSLKSFAQAMLQEGIEEGTQEYVDALLQYKLLNQDFDIKEVTKNAEKSALYGMIMGGIFNTPELVSSKLKGSVGNETKIDPQVKETSERIKVPESVTELFQPSTALKMIDMKKIVLGFLGNFQTTFNKMKNEQVNTNSKLVEKISREGIVHITKEEAAPKIMESGYIKTSNPLHSYGNPKSFFFAGIPNFGELCMNLDSFREKTVAVRIKPDINSIQDAKFKYRAYDDYALMYEGDYHFNKDQAEIIYLGLDVNREGNFYYKEISKEQYENYHPNINSITENAPKVIKNLADGIKMYLFGLSYQYDVLAHKVNKINEMNKTRGNKATSTTKVDTNKTNIPDESSNDIVAVQTELDKTAELLSLDKISKLLTNDEVANKFLDYQNNIEFFENKTPQAYIVGLEQYIEALKKEGTVINNAMVERFNTLKNYVDNMVNQENIESIEDIALFGEENFKDELFVQKSKEATAELIPIDKLEELLTSDETVNKFLDYENNQDYFNYKTQEGYLLAIEQYIEAYQKSGYNLSDAVIKRYSTIKNEVNAKLFSGSELKKEINSLIDPNWNQYQRARKLYIELNKRLSYSMDYLWGNEEVRRGMMLDQINFDILSSKNVICKGWSELYKELLLENGFSEDKVEIKGLGHNWIEIALDDGNIIIADATDAIAHTIDLMNCKAGFTTLGFLYTNNSYSGKRLNTLDLNLLKKSGTRWQEVDQSIGYLSGSKYFNETLEKADKLFANSKLYEKVLGKDNYSQKVNKMIEMEIPDDMSGYEAYSYFNYIKHTMFNETEQSNITVKLEANELPSGYEGIATLNISNNGNTSILVYGESIGKHTFNNWLDYDDFMKQLNIKVR